MIGQIVGNYKIQEKLGEGGMGSVYKGVDTMLDREVAIKALRPELASQDSIVERFRTEAVTLAKLNHPNIATLYSLFRQGQELYMVLEFVRGETLDSIMKKRGALPAEEAIPVFCQVLDGIDHAHELGIVHRDIKPANMMLTEKGTLKVLDFGIARLLGSARMTRAGNIIGTLEYMAPEQVRGLETDGRSDIYALGMMLYEVLTGRLPFDTQNEFELMKMQTEQTPVPPRELNPAIPEAVEAAIMRAVRKDPSERFQTAGDFSEMLLQAGLGVDAVMHGATGSFRRVSNSRPPVSKTGAISEEMQQAGDTLGAHNAAKPSQIPAPTRIATPASAPVVLAETAASRMATTRLGTPAYDPGVEPAEPKSFLSKLTIVHYGIAGTILLILIGVVVALPFMLLAGGSPAVNVVTANKTSALDTNVETRETPPQRAVLPATTPIPAPTMAETQLSPSSELSVERTKTDRTVVTQRPVPKKPASVPQTAKPRCTTEMKALGQC
jgi:serine/threonine protein kinase